MSILRKYSRKQLRDLYKYHELKYKYPTSEYEHLHSEHMLERIENEIRSRFFTYRLFDGLHNIFFKKGNKYER